MKTRVVHQRPAAQSLVVSGAKHAWALSEGVLFSLSPEGHATAVADGGTGLQPVLVMYEDDAGAVHVLTLRAGAVVRSSVKGDVFVDAGSWQLPFSGKTAFTYVPGRGLISLGEDGVLRCLSADQWSDCGKLSPKPKVSVSARGREFVARFEGDSGYEFPGPTEARAREAAEEAARRFDALNLAYEPATKRVLALAHTPVTGLRCYEVLPSTGVELATPPALPVSASQGEGRLAVDPSSGRVLLFRAKQAGMPAALLFRLEGRSWTPVSPVPAWSSLSSGLGAPVLLGAQLGDDVPQRQARFDGQRFVFSGGACLPWNKSFQQLVAHGGRVFGASDVGTFELGAQGEVLIDADGRGVAVTPDGVVSITKDGRVRGVDAKGGAGGGQRSFDASVAVAWSEALGGLITFGDDECSSDTWLFKAGTWKKLKPARKPKGRGGAAAVSTPGGVVLAAGLDGDTFNERWLFDGKTWVGGEKLAGLEAEKLVGLGAEGEQVLAFELEPFDRFEPAKTLELRVSRLAGKKWVSLAKVPLRSARLAVACFDAVTREVVAVGALNTGFQVLAVALGEAGGAVAAPPSDSVEVVAPTRSATPFKLTRKAPATGEDSVGGVAVLAAPKCKTCKTPMQALGLFHAHPQRLPLKSAALAAFHCGTCDNAKNAHAVVFLDAKALKAKAVGEPGVGVSFGKPVDETTPKSGGHKLGGFPAWVQGPELPSCGKCKKPMVLAVQLDGAGTGFNFGDVGMGYVFVCADAHQGRVVTQSS